MPEWFLELCQTLILPGGLVCVVVAEMIANRREREKSKEEDVRREERMNAKMDSIVESIKTENKIQNLETQNELTKVNGHMETIDAKLEEHNHYAATFQEVNTKIDGIKEDLTNVKLTLTEVKTDVSHLKGRSSKKGDQA